MNNDILKQIQIRAKKDGYQIEGAILAFKTKSGHTGTHLICNDRGTRLRLIEEGKIQMKIIDMENDAFARGYFQKLEDPLRKGDYHG